MIIKKVEIENYRNFDMASAEFSKFNVLIGKNGTGKSNFLNAMMLPLRGTTLNGKPFDPQKDKRKFKADTTISVLSELSEEKGTNIIPGNSGNIAPELLYQFLSKGDNNNLSIRINQTGTSEAPPNYKSSILTPAGQQIEVQTPFSKNDLDLLYGTFIYPLADSREMPEVFQPGMPKITSGFDFGNALLAMKLNFRDKYDNLIVAIKQISPEILDILVNLGQSNAWEIQFKETNVSLMLNAQGISKGTREIVMMLIILEAARKKSAILIEEPEVHLYPLAIKKLKQIMFQYIKDKQLQIIISTHSLEFLQGLYPSQDKDVKIFEFDKKDGVSSPKELREEKEIDEMIKRMSR